MNSVPPSASSNLPLTRCCAPVNAPALVSEQLAVEQRLAQRRRVERDERPILSRRRVVNGSRQNRLPGAGLPENQNRQVGPGGQPGAIETRLHARVARPEVVERRVGVVELVRFVGHRSSAISSDSRTVRPGRERLAQLAQRLHRVAGQRSPADDHRRPAGHAGQHRPPQTLHADGRRFDLGERAKPGRARPRTSTRGSASAASP